KLAATGNAKNARFPKGLRDESFNFSFSGVKTSVARRVASEPTLDKADVAAGFQTSVVEILVEKARRAVETTGAAALCLAGGVAANSQLRAATQATADELGIDCLIPAFKYCTDNAAMIAAAGWWRYQSDGPTPLDIGASPNLKLATA